MTKANSAETRDLLVKLCGMLGSDFEGERASAALKITGLLRRAGLRWDDVLSLPDAPCRPGPAAASGSEPRPIYTDWRADLACCERHQSLLITAEREYVRQLGALLGAGRTSVRAADRTKLAAIARRVRKHLSTVRRGRAAPEARV